MSKSSLIPTGDKIHIERLVDFAKVLQEDEDRKMMAILLTLLRFNEEGKHLDFEAAKKEVELLIETLLKFDLDNQSLIIKETL